MLGASNSYSTNPSFWNNLFRGFHYHFHIYCCSLLVASSRSHHIASGSTIISTVPNQDIHHITTLRLQFITVMLLRLLMLFNPHPFCRWCCFFLCYMHDIQACPPSTIQYWKKHLLLNYLLIDLNEYFNFLHTCPEVHHTFLSIFSN